MKQISYDLRSFLSILFLLVFLSCSNYLRAQSCTYSWTNQTSNTTANLVSIHAVSNTVGWVSGFGAVIRKTTDGGVTWTNGNPTTPSVITGDIWNIHAVDANIALCTTTPGTTTFIYRTSNGGTTWTQVFSQSGGFIDAIKMVDANTGYALGDPVGGIWVFLKTTNGGVNWAQQPGAPTAPAGEAGWIKGFDVQGNNIWWVSNTATGKIYRSTNAGANFTSVITGTAIGTFSSLKFDPNGSVGIATGGQGVVVRSTDAGETWTAITSIPGSGESGGVETEKNGANIDFYAYRGTGVQRSTNNGSTWTQVHTVPASFIGGISFAISSVGYPVGWVVCEAGFIAKMTPEPSPVSCAYSWSAQTSGTTSQLLSVSAVSDMIGWAAGVGSTVRRTINGGTTWTSVTGTGITGDVYNIYALNADTALCTTTPGATFIYRTINGGTTWTQVFTQAGGFIDAIQMRSPAEGYALGDPVGGIWQVLRTTNGGVNWAQMPSAPPAVGAEAGWNNSFYILGTNMWFGTNATRVYRSTNLGLNWTSAPTTGTVNTYAVHYNNTSNGLAAGTATVKSTDGGATYTAATSPGTAGNINGIDGSGTDWWSIRSGAIIYRSTDHAATWTTAHTQTGAVFQDIDFAVVNNCPTGWTVGNAGAIAKMSSTTGIINYNNEVPVSYDLSQNFPNPFNPSTNIKFSIPKSGIITLRVYDMIGKEIATLVNEFKGAGNYIVGFNASNLPSGTYFYRVTSGDFVDTKKMLLVK